MTIQVRRQLAVLRSEWRTWRRGTHPSLHPDYCLTCPTLCGQPGCEPCAMTAYRADRMAEISTKAAGLRCESGS